jgi:cytochrome c biogenesis protein CcmG/thiol:disulfide interchange protein DsbE
MLRRRLVFLLPLAVFALLAAYFVAGLDPGRDPSAVPSALIDQPVPDFALEALVEGAPGLASDELGGKVVLINFFASWCVPCRIEHPLLAQLARERGIPIYGIAYKDEPDAIKFWLADLGSPYARVLVDPGSRTALDFGVYGVPETYVIDRQGRIRFRFAGPLDPATIEQTLLPLIAGLDEGGE